MQSIVLSEMTTHPCTLPAQRRNSFCLAWLEFLLLGSRNGLEPEYYDDNFSNWPNWCTNYFFTIRLLYSSTCFEHSCVHHQEVKLYYTVSVIVILCGWPSGAQVERGLPEPAHRTATYRVWRYQMLYNTFWPPDDGHNNARKMLRNIINLL